MDARRAEPLVVGPWDAVGRLGRSYERGRVPAIGCCEAENGETGLVIISARLYSELPLPRLSSFEFDPYCSTAWWWWL